MHIDSNDYGPYFRDGLLFLPPKTVNLLVEAGLDEHMARTALRGLALDDDRELIGQISSALEHIMGQMAENSAVYQQLNTQEAHFLLKGRASH